MRTAILGGAGAMGGAMGAALFEGGHDVTLVDVAEGAVDRINAAGLVVQEKSGATRTVRVPASTDPATVAAGGPADLVVVFVKCYHTEAAVRGALPLVGPATTVLSLQNGWGNAARIGEIVGPNRVVPGVSYHSATLLGPGHVLHAGKGMTFIGETNGGTSDRLDRIVLAFKSAGLPVTATPTVLKEIWSKLTLNTTTLPNSAVTGVTADRLLATPEMTALMQDLCRETVAVANAQNIGLDYDERWTAISGLLGKLAPGTKGSMLQDTERRRRTEIDVITGAVVAAGRQFGVPTPANVAMLALVKSLEQTFA